MDSHLFGAVYAAEAGAEALVAVAREFSPRIAVPPVARDGREVVMDLSGVSRLFGDAHTIAAELRRTAADHGLRVRVALAGSRTAARLLVHHRPGVTVIEPGGEAVAVGSLPVNALRVMGASSGPAVAGGPVVSRRSAAAGPLSDPTPVIETLRRWGIRTLEQLAALPAADLAARLGQEGIRWQRVARGEDLDPLVPANPEERFEEALDLEWPIEGLEPLSFVLGRLLEPLSAHLERRDRGAAVLHVRLHLVTRELHERSLQLPIPMREPRTLRTLLLLDLESHPPAAAIDRVVVAVDPTPGRIIQYSLLTRPLPTPEQLSTLMARLGALMGETRCGSPAVVDSWQPGACAMRPFSPPVEERGARPDASTRDDQPRSGRGAQIPTDRDLTADRSGDESRMPSVALRRFRMPVVARVLVEGNQPVRVTTGRRGISGGRVVMRAGPWRTSGGWWSDRAPQPRAAGGGDTPAAAVASWDRDEWDVALADGVTYRIFRERDSEKWFVEGMVD